MRRQQRALQRLAWGLKRLSRGQVDFRLEAERRDEFNDVYRQFNRLAVRLDEHRSAGRADDPTEPIDTPTLRPIQGLPDDTLDLSAPPPAIDESSVTPLRGDRKRR
nr:HAMP domain-containing protein [Wenzhouxiangella sp. XN79A]